MLQSLNVRRRPTWCKSQIGGLDLRRSTTPSICLLSMADFPVLKYLETAQFCEPSTPPTPGPVQKSRDLFTLLCLGHPVRSDKRFTTYTPTTRPALARRMCQKLVIDLRFFKKLCSHLVGDPNGRFMLLRTILGFTLRKCVVIFKSQKGRGRSSLNIRIRRRASRLDNIVLLLLGCLDGLLSTFGLAQLVHFNRKCN